MRFFIALLLMAVLPIAHAAEAPRPGAAILETAKRNIRDGKLAEALAALDSHDKARKPTPESLDLRGSVYLEQGKFEEAAKAFDVAHTADLGIFTPRLHAADLLFRQRKYEEARKRYQQLLKETNILISNERLRYAILLTYLGARDENEAKRAFGAIVFPTESPAYYYAQAAWEFSHGNAREAKKWLSTADQIFEPAKTAWFARPLYDLGWIKRKPMPAVD